METQNQTAPEPSDPPTFTSDEDLQAGYFIQTLSSFWQRTDLSLEAKGLYALLLTYAGKNDRSWPGQARLSEQTGLSKNTLRERIDELSNMGLLSVTRRGQGKPNLYHLHSATVKPTGSNSGNPEAQNLNIKKRNNYTSRSSGIAHELYSEETYSINNTTTPLPPKPKPIEKPLVVDGAAKAKELLRSLIARPNEQFINGGTSKFINDLAGVFPEDWIQGACDLAAGKNASLTYVKAILDHWQRHGFKCECRNPKSTEPIPIQQKQQRNQQPYMSEYGVPYADITHAVNYPKNGTFGKDFIFVAKEA